MDDELKKILAKIMEGQEALRLGQESLRLGQEEIKKDVVKLGMKIDGEITDKLKILTDEQSIMRKDIQDIKDQQAADKQILLDIKLSTDILNNNQKKQESKIIELDQKLAK